MEEQVLAIAKQGPYALLFVWLLLKTIRESKEREERLMNHVERTTDTLQQIEKSITGMQEEIKDIREKVES